MDRMGSSPIPPPPSPIVSITIMLNFDCDLDGHGDGDVTCKQNFHFNYGKIKNLSTILFQINPQAVDSINDHDSNFILFYDYFCLFADINECNGNIFDLCPRTKTCVNTDGSFE